jgi:hypothetical protein
MVIFLIGLIALCIAKYMDKKGDQAWEGASP